MQKTENTYLTIATRGKIPGFVSRVTIWYRVYGRNFPWRRRSASNFQRVVCELLLQRTRAESVAAAYYAFFRRFPSWASVAKSSTEQIGEVLKPLGLWRRRADSLRQLAIVMDARRGRFPQQRSEIEQLPGVGQYVANSIELFTSNKPRPLLDTNMARVLERYFGPRKLIDIRHDPYLQELASSVVAAGQNARELNWAILDLAALVCKTHSPQCDDCPLAKTCDYPKS